NESSLSACLSALLCRSARRNAGLPESLMPASLAAMPVKLFILLLMVISALGTGCQSDSLNARGKRRMFIPGPTPTGQLIPQTHFLKGESPVICLVGYGGQTVVLEMTRNSAPFVQQQFTIPGKQIYQREAMRVETRFGNLRLVRGKQYVTYSTDADITF